MLRIVSILLVLSTMPAPAAAGPRYPGTITGDILLRSYLGPSERRDDPFLKAGDIVDRQLARGFMDGIKDATEGSAWCYVSGKPHELNDDIAAELSKLPPKVLQGRAAPLVVAALRQRHPCPSGARKAP